MKGRSISVAISTLYLLFTFAAEMCDAQVPSGKVVRKQLIIDFYDLILSKNPVSISDSKRIFGIEAELWEEGLFMDSCLRRDTEDKCTEALYKWFEHPTLTKSLFFAEIVKKRDSIASSKILVEDAIKRIRFRSENVAELRYRNSKVIFVFTNPEIDDFCITDIFMNSGASIFNDIPGAQKNYFK